MIPLSRALAKSQVAVGICDKVSGGEMLVGLAKPNQLPIVEIVLAIGPTTGKPATDLLTFTTLCAILFAVLNFEYSLSSIPIPADAR